MTDYKRCPKCQGKIILIEFIESSTEHHVDPDTGKTTEIEGSGNTLGATDWKYYCPTESCQWDSWQERDK